MMQLYNKAEVSLLLILKVVMFTTCMDRWKEVFLIPPFAPRQGTKTEATFHTDYEIRQ